MAVPALIREQSETDSEGRLWFTGVFGVEVDAPDGRVELSGWDAALRWATARASVVCVDFEQEGGRYTASGTDPLPEDDPGFRPPLSAELQAVLRQGRRRPLADRWLDRTEADPPIEWEVTVALEPDLIAPDVIEPAGRLAECLADGLRVEGLRDVRWSDDGLVHFLRETPAEGGWVFSGTLGVELVAGAFASTHDPIGRRAVEVVRTVLDRINHRMPRAVPDGDRRPAWDGRVDVHPPGYEPPFGSAYRGLGTVDVPPDWR